MRSPSSYSFPRRAMSTSLDRRRFLETAASLSVAFGATRLWAQDNENEAGERPADGGTRSANETLTAGVMGVNGRGTALARNIARLQEAEVAYVCDVDSRALDRSAAAVAQDQDRKPQTASDVRKMLDDGSLDVLIVAAPDHWHAPATILGCAAGKHVYVEKPCCHNPREGELMVAAARRHKRVVQMGTQRRSWAGFQEIVAKMADGAIGDVLYAKSWYNNRRPNIGHGKQIAVPEWLDWKLWQGPAPHVPLRDNIVHYNWHWFWDWGTGELGNNGVHSIDICRWGLGVDYPTRVTSGGGKYRHDDDQQTPDTQVVTCEFDGKTLVWEGRSWSPRGSEGSSFGMEFCGTEGTIVVLESDYVVYDMKRKEIAKASATRGGGDQVHLANFLDAIRTGAKPTAEIEEGYKSTLLCHLGNIAQRTGGALDIDPTSGHIKGNPAAEKLWSRQYESGWEPKV